MIVGITGGIGSGKSCVTYILKEHGFYVIDADKLAREVVKKGQPALNKLVKAFGDDILTKDGRLNRKRLGRLCFADDKKYLKLNKILGDEIKKLALEKIRKHQNKNIALEVILLFESGWDEFCDKTIAVCADKEVRIDRVIKRDKCTKEDALNRISKQMSDSDYIKYADIVVYNNSTIKQLEKDVLRNLEIKKG